MAAMVQEMARPEHESTPGRTILQWIEILTKIGLFLTTFGYLSLRAHLTTIGLSAESLGVERYTLELPEIIGALVYAVLWLMRFVVAGGLLFLILRRFLPNLECAAFERWAGSLAAPWAMAALLIIVYWTLLNSDAFSGRLEIAVGDLSNGATGRGSQMLFFAVFYTCVAGLGLSEGLGRLARRQGSRHARWWFVSLGITGMLSLQLPVIYGRTLHSSEFPRIQVVTTGAANAPAPSCGLLLLESTSGFHIWTVRNNAGLIEVVPRGEVKQFITGRSADLWDIVNQVAQKRAVSLCPTT